ncbi:MAG: NAD(P)-dependent oxidoreductase [Xanthobacteraceae bacterium]|nr:MAG: NAD(P)-dependent oxidoreductase [Xanthobacteraceae bacterium]
MKVLVAGATGAIGRRLIPLLLQAGHTVTGTTRAPSKAPALKAFGVTPMVVDVFDPETLICDVAAASPDVIIHQLTDLPQRLEGADMNAALDNNARVRIEGTRNLMKAAREAGVPRVIAQSIAWVYADGPRPFTESAPLMTQAEGMLARTLEGVRVLEQTVLSDPVIVGLVLRYGRLYGPGTWTEVPPKEVPLHVDAAAHAALMAITRGAAGIYNVAEEDGYLSAAKAKADLGFDPAFRLPS